MDEGIAEKYLKLLNDPEVKTEHARLLDAFYREMFNIDSSVKDSIMFRRLVKIYGDNIVFKSILELETIPDVNFNNIYRLFIYLCNRQLNNSESTKKFPILETERNFTKKKFYSKIGDPFNE